jgi:hypothetical protein
MAVPSIGDRIDGGHPKVRSRLVWRSRRQYARIEIANYSQVSSLTLTLTSPLHPGGSLPFTFPQP